MYREHLFRPINESWSTMRRQLKDYFFGPYDYYTNKRVYFDSMYEISGELKLKLIKWIKEIPNVVYIPENESEQFLDSIDVEVEKRGSGATTKSKDRDFEYTTYSEKEYRIETEKRAHLHGQARSRDFNSGMTTCTTVYPLRVIGNNVCFVYFTFDDDKIFNAQVIIKNKYSKGKDIEKYDAVTIRQWRSVHPGEYMRKTPFYN